MATPKIQQAFYPVTPKIEDPDLAPPYQEYVPPAGLMLQEGGSAGFFSTHKLVIVFGTIIVIIFLVILYVYLTHRGSAKKDTEPIVAAKPPLDLAGVDLAELNQLRARRLQRERIAAQGELQMSNGPSFRGGSSDNCRATARQFAQNPPTGGDRVPSVAQNGPTFATTLDRQTPAREGQTPSAAGGGQTPAREGQTQFAAPGRQTPAREGHTPSAAPDRQTPAREGQMSVAPDRQTPAKGGEIPSAAPDRQTPSRDEMSARGGQASAASNGPPIHDKSAAQFSSSEVIDSQNSMPDEESLSYGNDEDLNAYLGSLQFDNNDDTAAPAHESGLN